MKTRLLILGLLIGGILVGCNDSGGPEVKTEQGDSGGSIKALSPDGTEVSGGGVEKVKTD